MLKTLFNQNSIADKYKNLVNQINVLENTMQTLTDSELRAKTFELKKIFLFFSFRENIHSFCFNH